MSDKYIKLEDAIKYACNAHISGCVGDRIKAQLQNLPTIEVSEDCISREYLRSKVYDADNDDLVVDWEDIANAPSVISSRPRGEWISCSERLPEEDGRYLVRLEEHDCWDEITILPFEVGCESFGYWDDIYDYETMGFVDSEWEEYPVIAWMPLPELCSIYERRRETNTSDKEDVGASNE